MSYSYSQFVTDLKDKTHNKLGSIVNLRSLINKSVRETNALLDLAGTKRLVRIPTGFFTGKYQVPCPTDMKQGALIDINPLRDRTWEKRWTRVTPEEFYSRLNVEDFLCSIDNDQAVQTILANAFGDSVELVFHEMDAITDPAGGTWSAALDAENLALDTVNYLTGNASIRFDTKTGLTLALLQNSTVSAIDASAFINVSSVFLSLYIPSDTAAAATTAVGISWGDTSLAYMTGSASTVFDGTPFKAGWNIIKIDWSSATKVGSPAFAGVTYFSIAIGKSAALAATKGWRIDKLSVIKGDLNNISYYSNYYWKSSAGTLLENSTADTDVVNGDEDEYDLYVARAAFNCAKQLRERDDITMAKEEFKELSEAYKKNYKSEKLPLIETYFDLPTI